MRAGSIDIKKACLIGEGEIVVINSLPIPPLILIPLWLSLKLKDRGTSNLYCSLFLLRARLAVDRSKPPCQSACQMGGLWD